MKDQAAALSRDQVYEAYRTITALADKYTSNHDYKGYRFNSLQQVLFGEYCHGKLPDFMNCWAEELQAVCREKGLPHATRIVMEDMLYFFQDCLKPAYPNLLTGKPWNQKG